MVRMAVVMSVAALVVAGSTAQSQAKPNFAGKWTLVPDPNAPPPTGRGRGGGGGMLGGLGAEATLAQDEKTLTITRTTQAGEIKTVYNLDGTDSKNTLALGANPIELLSKATWEGTKLVVKTTANFGGNPFETTSTYSLNASGNLVLETTGSGMRGGAPTTTKATYKKG